MPKYRHYVTVQSIQRIIKSNKLNRCLPSRRSLNAAFVFCYLIVFKCRPCRFTAVYWLEVKLKNGRENSKKVKEDDWWEWATNRKHVSVSFFPCLSEDVIPFNEYDILHLVDAFYVWNSNQNADFPQSCPTHLIVLRLQWKLNSYKVMSLQLCCYISRSLHNL